jgi:hypothetical protein
MSYTSRIYVICIPDLYPRVVQRFTPSQMRKQDMYLI